MKHEIYGGSNFPFMTGFKLSVGMKWVVYAALLTPFIFIIASVIALIWWLV